MMPWRGRPAVRPLLFLAPLLSVVLFMGVLTFGLAETSAAQQCPDGEVLSDNGVTCEPAPEETGLQCLEGQVPDASGLLCVDPPPSVCPDGERLDDAGLFCIPDVPDEGDTPCPPGEKLDEAGLLCVVDESVEAPENPCESGFSLGADGETCVSDGGECNTGEVLGDDGKCVKTFKCSPGLVLSSDLLRCISGSCPDGELLSVDGSRCIAPDSNCPDGSPRPVGGACLVVETVENPDGTTEIVVRCDGGDSFCQALINQCAEERAAGSSDPGEGDCADPRTSCDDGDDDCEAANERLVECATFGADDLVDDDGEARDRSEACDDLCPRLHLLDASGECVEFLDPTHPCVSFGRVPSGVTTNAQLDNYSFLAGTGQCVTRSEFLRRLGNFEAAAGAELDALELLRATTSTYLTVEEQLAALEERLTESELAVVDFAEAAALADLERAENEKLLIETGKQLSRERELLRAEVLSFFVAGGTDVAVAKAVLGAENFTEIGVTRAYGRALLSDQVEILERVTLLEGEQTQLAIALDLAAEAVRESLESAIEAKGNVETLLAEATEIRTAQLARRDEEAALVSVLREDKAGFARELGIFDQASREIADIISESEFLVTSFQDFDGLLALPVIPAIVSSGFGPRLHPILGYVRNHDGFDFNANFGDPIYASAPGVVQIASTFGGYGKTVVLDHGGGLLTLYAHQSAIGVEAGDLVERGDILGLVGSTGLSTGPHLHFEVWVGQSTAVDPAQYLPETD